MKKIILALCMILMAVNLFAKEPPAWRKSLPDWVQLSLNGDFQKVAESLGIDPEVYKVFCSTARYDPEYTAEDLKNCAFIDEVVGIEVSICSAFGITGTLPCGGKVETKVEEDRENKKVTRMLLISFEDKSTGKTIPYLEMTEDEKKIHLENLEAILPLVKKSAVGKSLRLDSDYSLYFKKDAKTKQITMVEDGQKRKADVCEYYAVYVMPVSSYDGIMEDILMKAME